VKIVDLDRLTNEKRISAAAVLLGSCYRRSGDNVIQVEPFYWFSTAKRDPRAAIEAIKLPPLGTAICGPSLEAMLKDMIAKIDGVAEKCGMGSVGKFRRPVTLLTDILSDIIRPNDLELKTSLFEILLFISLKISSIIILSINSSFVSFLKISKLFIPSFVLPKLTL